MSRKIGWLFRCHLIFVLLQQTNAAASLESYLYSFKSDRPQARRGVCQDLNPEARGYEYYLTRWNSFNAEFQRQHSSTLQQPLLAIHVGRGVAGYTQCQLEAKKQFCLSLLLMHFNSVYVWNGTFLQHFLLEWWSIALAVY